MTSNEAIMRWQGHYVHVGCSIRHRTYASAYRCPCGVKVHAPTR